MKLIKRFAELGLAYRTAYLGHYDAARLRNDPLYGLCAFLFTWAFERADAPRGYRIAAVKAVRDAASSGFPLKTEKLQESFAKFYQGKVNPKNNPLLAPTLAELDIPSLISDLEAIKIERAYAILLRVGGIGPKISTFFLRDVISILHCESKVVLCPETYLWFQPVDIWIRVAADLLARKHSFDPTPPHGPEKLKRDDLAAAWNIICMCQEAEVSPISVNQGLWYFCSNCVADSKRLEYLLSTDEPERVDCELALMEGFLPVRPFWGNLAVL